jgi:DNA repair protein RadC
MDRERCNFVYNGRVKSFILTFRYSIENNTQTLSMQEHKPPINQWAIDDRPREKLLRKKPNSLSDSELVAILIRIGSRQTNAVELARKVLELGKNNLNELAKLTLDELMQVKGIGQAKASAIVAALELGRRRLSLPLLDKTLVRNSREVAGYLQALLRDHLHEVFAVIFLNRAGRIKHFEIVSQGGIAGTVVDPRLIIKKALAEDAVSLIICHNHPSGNLHPSKADEEVTAKIKMAAAYFDIKLLDHIIVSEEGHFSFADEGML